MSQHSTLLARIPTWNDDELVQISALQHYVYCPRQCALIHVEQVWDENVYTLRGRRVHENVDTPAYEQRGDTRTEFALPLFSDRLGLVGKADSVEFSQEGQPYPVEHKVGKRSKSSRGRHADAVQLCAQALCLEDMFETPIAKGAISYRASNRRVEIAFTPELRAEVEATVGAVRELLLEQQLPPPAADDRCRQCSLIDSCMPFVAEHITTIDEDE